MNEYIPIHPNTLTGIADEVRRLGNIDDKVTTEQMIRISANTADEVDNQTELIQQIKTALEDKAAGGGVQLPTLTNPGTADDLVEGKQLIDANGDVITGVLSKGFAVKTGSTMSGTINTGLSDIEQFFIYRDTVYTPGLVHLRYTKSKTSRTYASTWSGSNKVITYGADGVSVSGGTVTISATDATQGALASNGLYTWVAVGTE